MIKLIHFDQLYVVAATGVSEIPLEPLVYKLGMKDHTLGTMPKVKYR
ncbi:hypothetical protein MADE_1014680 [Alteromonas mediterranea DE]|uniref:Uncharacterized protein n=1 Tax=Alteromonas mediterranea (strain DSM 17117 / CIP 110805 / LMG 28347 / Deep ecotype) TaxID=1774373 RepID=F2GCB4_ALTMD|nr:hypothetical protein MADE_1014680 [Alteromonas mediterranea DE]